MPEDIQVVTIVVIGTVLLIVLVSFVVLSLYFYQRSQHRHHQSLEGLKHSFQQEILKTELEIKEQTLQVIAQEIHDNIGQILSLAKLNLNKVLQPGETIEAEKIQSVKELVGKAIQDLRNLSRTMNGEYICHQSLPAVIQSDLQLIQASGVCKTFFQVSGAEIKLDPQRQLVIYRIVQESMANILKHAQATVIRVDILYTPENLSVKIEDNGKGIESQAIADMKRSGTGIFNMQNRARLIGANLNIETENAQGTTVELTLSLVNV